MVISNLAMLFPPSELSVEFDCPYICDKKYTMELSPEMIQKAVYEALDKKAHEINDYKLFYNTHLIGLKSIQKPLDRIELLSNLAILCRQFNEVAPQRLPVASNAQTDLLYSAEIFMKKHFSEALWKEYNKHGFPMPAEKSDKHQNDSIARDILNGIKEMAHEAAAEWNHKKNFLIQLYNCINDYGLHPKIHKRDPEVYKRYNLLVFHSLERPIKNYYFECLLTYQELEEQFISKFKFRKPIQFGGVFVKFDEITEMKITTTLLKSDEIKLFALKEEFVWEDGDKHEIGFIYKCTDETKKYVPYPEENNPVNNVDQTQVKQVKALLKPYPASLKAYTSALEKFQKGIYQRNALDDLRLSLELLLKGIFKNEKSLENQLSEVGTLQKQNGKSAEISNMFPRLLEYYAKYHNSHVKHNDRVNESEIELMIELTSTFMKFIVKK
jgi:hypothetical protein